MSTKDAPISTKPSRDGYFLFLILVGAALVRFYSLGGKQLWLDEVIQVIHSSPAGFWEILSGVTDDRGAAPLDYLIQHCFLVLFGPGEFAARFHAAVFGTVTVAVLYLLTQKLLERKIAIISATLFAVYPLHLHYSQEGRPYALFTLLAALSYLIFLYVIEQDRLWQWLLYLLVLVVCFYSHYYTAFVAMSQTCIAAYLIILRRGGEQGAMGRAVGPKLLLKMILVQAAAFVFFVPWIIYGIRTIYGYEPAPEAFGLRLLLRGIKELGDGSFPMAVVLIVMISIGVWAMRRDGKASALGMLLLWGVMPIVPILLLLWTKDYFFAIRQTLFMTPALYILAAYGVSRSSEILARGRSYGRSLPAFCYATVLITSLTVIGLHLADRRPDFKGASAFLKKTISPGDTLVVPEVAYFVLYYAPELRPSVVEISPGCDIECIVAKGQTVYFVDTEYQRPADRERVERLLTSWPSVTFQNRGLRIYRFSPTAAVEGN